LCTIKEQKEEATMVKVTEEERQDRIRGDRAGRNQARKGKPWGIEEEGKRSEIYRTAHRKAYLSTIVSLNITVVEPTPKQPKVLSDERVAQIHKQGYESGLADGFRQALLEFREAPIKLAREQGEWSNQKKNAYQLGYRHSMTGRQPRSPEKLRSDPELNDGYKMGYQAGCKLSEKLETA
jgi:hypothetical protein